MFVDLLSIPNFSAVSDFPFVYASSTVTSFSD